MCCHYIWSHVFSLIMCEMYFLVPYLFYLPSLYYGKDNPSVSKGRKKNETEFLIQVIAKCYLWLQRCLLHTGSEQKR